MKYKKYKKKELVNIINNLSEEINNLNIELKNKNRTIMNLMEEKEEEIGVENESKLIKYLKKQIKTTSGNKKKFYEDYLEIIK